MIDDVDRITEKELLILQTVDYITCIACQADLGETKHEHDDDWPEWLIAGCCSPECHEPLATHTNNRSA